MSKASRHRAAPSGGIASRALVTRAPLLVRGIWWRRQVAVVILIAAIITTGAAALGPLYARAAAESTLRDELVNSGWPAGLHFQNTADFGSIGIAAGDYDRDLQKSPAPGSIRGYPTRIGSMLFPTGAFSGDAPVKTQLVWRQGVCGHLTVAAGRCPSRAGEVMVSERTVKGGYGWKLGGTVSIGATGGSEKIVGVYIPKNTLDDYWFGSAYFTAAPSPDSGADTIDALLTSRAEFRAIQPEQQVAAYADYPLDPAAIRLANTQKLGSDVAALKSHYKKSRVYQLTTDLPKVLAAAAHQQQLINVGTLLVTVQLALLGWLIFYQIVTDAVEGRGPEIALAKLRGHGAWGTIRFGLAEPLILLLVSLPFGFLAAWAASLWFASFALVPGTPVIVTWQSPVAMLVALVGGFTAAALAARRVLTRPVLEQWRRTTDRPHTGRTGLIVDGVVIVASVAGFLVLRLAPAAAASGDPLVLLAPGLLVAAVALVGTRLLPIVVALAIPATRSSRSIGLFLASRQVVRRPAGLRLATLLAVAVGLASFGVGGEAVAITNRNARASAELGASSTVGFQYDRSVDPVAAIRRADPDGTWAMAAASWLPDGGDSVIGTVLGVDASRLAKVALPTAGGPSLKSLARTIGGATVPPIVLKSTRLRFTITASGLSALKPIVQADFTTDEGVELGASAGILRDGSHSYTASIPCANGCTFEGLTWYRPVATSNPITGRAVLTGLSESNGGIFRALRGSFTTAGAWRAAAPLGEASDSLSTTANGVVDSFSSRNGGYGGLVYASLPDPIPAAANHSALRNDAQTPKIPAMTDQFGFTGHIGVQTWSPVLPVVLDNGIIMNLAYLRETLPGFSSEANWQVWLSASAPADALAKLRASGLTLQSTTASEQTRVAELGRQAPALSLLLLLVSAIVGAILAGFGTAISIAAAGRRRSYESAAMRAIGVPRGQLFQAAVLEQVILLGAAVVLGIPAGLLAAVLALPVVPEFATSTPVALNYAPPLGPVLLFGLVFVFAVIATAVIAARSVMRAARPGRLREAEE
jgi:putative ABC transport system permease protein